MTDLRTTETFAQVVVLRRPARPPRIVLDPCGTLDLALLGAVAQRTVTLDRVVDIVGCLAGDGWRLSREVVYDTLQCATRSGLVSARETWVNSVPFVYALTPTGALRFTDLMHLPLPHDDTPDACAAASVKYGLLDLVNRQEIDIIVADLRRFYQSCRTGLESSVALLPASRPYLERTIRERQAWIDRRIALLDDLAARPVAPPADRKAAPVG